MSLFHSHNSTRSLAGWARLQMEIGLPGFTLFNTPQGKLNVEQRLETESASQSTVVFCFCYFSLSSWTATEKGYYWDGKRTDQTKGWNSWVVDQIPLLDFTPCKRESRSSSRVQGDTEGICKTSAAQLGRDWLDSLMSATDSIPDRMTRHMGLNMPVDPSGLDGRLLRPLSWIS